MIILVIFALALIIFSFLKPKWAFYLLLALIPFHAFLFTTFNELLNLTGRSSQILASWKDYVRFDFAHFMANC